MNASPLHDLCPDASDGRARPGGALCSGRRLRRPRRRRPRLSPQRRPKLGFTTEAGLLLVQIKGDQTAVFEELVTKLKAGAAKAEDATVKQQLSNVKVYKTAEGAAGGTRSTYSVRSRRRRTPSTSCSRCCRRSMTPDELRAPETQEFFKKATGRVRGWLQQAEPDASQVGQALDARRRDTTPECAVVSSRFAQNFRFRPA